MIGQNAFAVPLKSQHAAAGPSVTSLAMAVALLVSVQQAQAAECSRAALAAAALPDTSITSVGVVAGDAQFPKSSSLNIVAWKAWSDVPPGFDLTPDDMAGADRAQELWAGCLR